MIWRWNDHYWHMRVVYTVATDAAEKRSAQRPHATGAHHNQLRLVILCQFADHFSRFVALFFVQFDIQLQEN